jgi:oxygen-independent coproporphyrinogen III oxidase
MTADSIRARVELARRHPLDFTLQYPPRREYFQDFFRGPADLRQAQAEREMLLYVHVPFCQAKCYFCNFAVDIRTAPEIHQRYTDLLCEQIRRIDAFLPEETRVPGIDIGGGTPTLLQEHQLRQILLSLAPFGRRATGAHPLSIETTPRIAAEHPERLAVLREGGVTRISMGVQSANAATLAAVNRQAQENMTEKAVANMRRAGFRRINVDVIFGLPKQTEADWRATIEAVLAMGVDSVTTYDCLYRGKGRAMTKRMPDRPTPEMYGGLYDLSYDMLAAAGFHAAYGSVNFSRHAGETGTSPYFEGRLFDHTPYVGAGNYASSMVGDAWWFAPYGVNEWSRRIEAGDILPQGDSYRLPPEEMMAKQVLLSFNYGVIDGARFEGRFGIPLETVYGPALAFGVSQGWLQRKGKVYGVAPGQFRNMPQIRALFYPDEAAGWLRGAAYAPPERREREAGVQRL